MPIKTPAVKVGVSSSPLINKVVKNSWNQAQPVSVTSANKQAFNKKPIKVGGK